MPILRLFAAAREAAGVPRADIDGATVAEVLAEATQRYGPDFASVVAASRIWVNGQPVHESAPVAPHDVVAVLPPVSGGSGTPAPDTITSGSPGEWKAPLPSSPLRGERSPSFSVDDFASRWKLPSATASMTAVADRPAEGGHAAAFRFDLKWPDLSVPLTPLEPPAGSTVAADDPESTQAWFPPSLSVVTPEANEEGNAHLPPHETSDAGLPATVTPLPGTAPVGGIDDTSPPPDTGRAAAQLEVPPPAPGGTPSVLAVAAGLEAHPRAVELTSPEAAPAVDRPALSVVQKADRPHGRLGLAWAVVTAAATVAGPGWLAGWLAGVAFAGASQSARVWRDRNERPMPVVSACTAAGLPLAAGFGLTALTGVTAAAVVVSLVTRLRSQTRAPARDVALTLALGVPLGLAAAAPVLLRHIDVQAPLLLLAYAAVYDAGAYLVGTGASSPWEGPVAGITALVPLTIFAAVVFVPPFQGISPLVLGVVAAVCAPLGPLAGSALLGDGEVDVPGLRRLDSLLVLGPVWSWCAAAFLLEA